MFIQNIIYYYNDEFYYVTRCFSTLKNLKKEIIRLNGKIVHEKIFHKKNVIVKKELLNLEKIYKEGKIINKRG